MAKVYIIGSLRNPAVPKLAMALREEGYEVFDDWYAAGEKADDAWQAYEQARGRTYPEALIGHAANHVFNFDFEHLNSADIGILVAPAGKSCHLELGWMIGRGKPGFILLAGEPERWDVMYKLAHGVYLRQEDLVEGIRQAHNLREMRRGDVQGSPDFPSKNGQERV